MKRVLLRTSSSWVQGTDFDSRFFYQNNNLFFCTRAMTSPFLRMKPRKSGTQNMNNCLCSGWMLRLAGFKVGSRERSVELSSPYLARVNTAFQKGFTTFTSIRSLLKGAKHQISLEPARLPETMCEGYLFLKRKGRNMF